MTWVCLKMGYTPNEIAIFRRDNDQQNHWVCRGLAYFQTNPVCSDSALQRHQGGSQRTERVEGFGARPLAPAFFPLPPG